MAVDHVPLTSSRSGSLHFEALFFVSSAENGRDGSARDKASRPVGERGFGCFPQRREGLKGWVLRKVKARRSRDCVVVETVKAGVNAPGVLSHG